MTGNREVITGNDFKRMIAGAYSAFLLEYENINALNADSLMDEKAPMRQAHHLLKPDLPMKGILDMF